MRFLIVPNLSLPYDQRMVNGLAAGFHEIGHEAVALSSPVPAEPLAGIVKRIGADVVIQVNRFRQQDPPLPQNVRHVAWFQDVFPDTLDQMKAGEREGDVVYALGDAGVLGLNTAFPCFVGSLVTGVEPSMLGRKRKVPSAEMVDFSLCGYIPQPLAFKPNIKSDLVWYLNDLVDRVPLLGRSWNFRHLRFRLLRRYIHRNYVPYALAIALQENVTAVYRPLRGELDIDMISGVLRAAAQNYVNIRKKQPVIGGWPRRGRLGHIMAPYRASGADTRTALDHQINALAREYPRLLDRVALINAALDVSKSLELYGPGWNAHETFLKYHKGIVSDPDVLLSIYERSRINLANNTHGLGLHSRTLECMAVGGFIFMHTSPHDEKPGGMLTAFEPDVHYGAYTPETFRDEAGRWLRDDTARAQAGERAAAVIKAKHLWLHRAEQITEDVKR
jgi:hypothetical protein